MRTRRNIALLTGLDGSANDAKRVYLFRLHDILQERGWTLHLLDLCGKQSQPARHVFPFKFLDAPKDFHAHAPEALDTAIRWHAEMRNRSLDAAARHIRAGVHALAQRLEKIDADLCVLWNQFTPLNHAASAHLASSGIPMLYGHLGLLPGTVVFEKDGQMGESWVCRENARFQSLTVSETDYSLARAYLEKAREAQWTRKPQGEAAIVARALADHPFANRPVVFYAGQNDYAAGILPEYLPNCRLHSPHFRDTTEALAHLASLAREQDWLILFKPHPNVTASQPDLVHFEHERVLVLPGANVFACMQSAAVTATIVSQVAYLAMIQSAPAALLGTMPLSGKDCIYEAASRGDVAKTIRRAMDAGTSAEQEANWIRHVARLLNHYLFPLDDDIAAHCGRTVHSAADFLIDHSSARNAQQRTRETRAAGTSPLQEARITAIIKDLAQSAGANAAGHKRYLERTRWRVVADYRFLLNHLEGVSSVLDVGAVPPMLAALLRNHVEDVTIADPGAAAFAGFLERSDIQWREQDLLDDSAPPFDRQFGLVCFCEVIEHLTGNLPRALSRVVDAVAPGGMLYVTTVNLRSITGFYALLRHHSSLPSKMTNSVRDQYDRLEQSGYYGHVREYTAREVRVLFQSFGLEHVASRYQTHPRAETLERRALRFFERMFPSMRLFGKHLFRKP